MQKNRLVIQRFLAMYIVAVCIVIGIVLFKIVRQEVRTSKYQAHYLSQISKQLSFKLSTGSSTSIRYPEFGPYDERLGYTSLPEVIKRLENNGYAIAAQASFSPMMTELVDYGLFTIYHEKNQAGLRILDQADQVIFNAVYPTYGYPNFDAIPPVILNTLLFIENRELFDEQNTQVNPAVEWDRLGFAGLQMMANKLGATSNVPGGSTLATQIEKYRHSPNGYTNSIMDKFRQMGSASIRAYLLGPDTRAMRREIALAYLNSMPLAAAPKLGEVHGLGDGLSAWFGADFGEVNKLLSSNSLTTENITEHQAQAYRQVLNILLSQRRPSYLLGKGYSALQNLTNSYLRLLAEQGVISIALRDAALQASTIRPLKSSTAPVKFATEKKTQTVLRTRLAKTLAVKSNYELDRLDLTVKTTLDYNAQHAVTEALRRLSDPVNARAAGILGFRMLDENIDLAPIVYSLMLFEIGKTGNLLRVQTDNYDQPLDINEGIRIDLGSTAKLRTMVHYLELITDIYERYKDSSSSDLSGIELHPRDYLSAWVIEQLRVNQKVSLEELLNLGLDRRYSASPGESFFTGGGLHTFSNFTKDENGKIMSVRHALRDSVNLVFIRLMRDLVYHHLYKPDGIARWLETLDDPKRKEYLQRFADNEGRVYLQRFYARYRDKTPEEALDLLTQRVVAKPARLTMLYRAIYPDHYEDALNQYLNAHLSKAALADQDIYSLYDKYSVEKFDLQDQGYITKIHPLELWLVSYLAQHPKATYKEIIDASAEQRQQVYRWLIKSRKKYAQQRRIMTLLETEAFREIHRAWERVGYPFGGLTSSYATSIGASGDRPAALAELSGILRNDGVRLPIVRFESLHFAKGTPYETLLNKLPDQGERVLAPEIARVARGAMSGVVNGGTASRLRGVYTDAAGNPLDVGGKTGTGDHRKEIWGAGGRLIESKFISRAATFTFFLGDQFFGVITAYVTGENAGRYHFTSSLPVQILKFLKPTLSPLLTKASPDNMIAKPLAKEIMVESLKPVAKAAVVKSVKAPIKKTPAKKPAALVKVKDPVAKNPKPPVTDIPVKNINPLVKTAPVKATKPPVKSAPTENTKPLTKNTAISADKNDSATRYYKYPEAPKPTQQKTVPAIPPIPQ
ncbi:MAG: transglycosylase domain-containing protein [Methylococcaceae bacterium]